MDKKTVNLEIINGLKSKGINIAEVEKNHLEAFADIMYKAINYSQCCTGLKPKQECYKSGKPCEYNCSGLCKESCQGFITYNSYHNNKN